jgi:hypothetical protein
MIIYLVDFTFPRVTKTLRESCNLFLDLDTRRSRRVSVTPRPHSTPGKDPVPIVQDAGWAPGPVWTFAENNAPTGIRSPDHPARSQSLYRLRYPAHMIITLILISVYAWLTILLFYKIDCSTPCVFPNFCTATGIFKFVPLTEKYITPTL